MGAALARRASRVGRRFDADARRVLIRLAELADRNDRVEYRELADWSIVIGLDVPAVERGLFALVVGGLLAVTRGGDYFVLPERGSGLA